jgi:hypothetical protein
MPTCQQLPHIIAFLLLLARLGDVGSTYLISPTLKLGANPIVRRLRWPFAGFTVLAAAIPYYSLPAGVAVLVVSLLVCASNCSRVHGLQSDLSCTPWSLAYTVPWLSCDTERKVMPSHTL